MRRRRGGGGRIVRTVAGGGGVWKEGFDVGGFVFFFLWVLMFLLMILWLVEFVVEMVGWMGWMLRQWEGIGRFVEGTEDVAAEVAETWRHRPH